MIRSTKKRTSRVVDVARDEDAGNLALPSRKTLDAGEKAGDENEDTRRTVALADEIGTGWQRPNGVGEAGNHLDILRDEVDVCRQLAQERREGGAIDSDG